MVAARNSVRISLINWCGAVPIQMHERRFESIGLNGGRDACTVSSRRLLSPLRAFWIAGGAVEIHSHGTAFRALFSFFQIPRHVCF
jgi:hypothetical protein